VPIIAAMRINLKTNNAYSSYTELMGQPGATVTDTRYIFPWYNNTGLLDSQLRFANVGTASTTVTIKVGGSLAGSFNLDPKASMRVSLLNVDSGPVEVSSSGGVPIIAALRINLKKNSAFSSYFEFMGMSTGSPLGLPGNQLSTTYWFPWYNNTGQLDSQLRFGMP
jgi:hypothetical protein